MKKFPVFQFPPPTGNPTSPVSSDDKMDTEEQGSACPSAAELPRDASNQPSESSPESSTPVSVICRPPTSSAQLADKLSGAKDPCLSEAAQKDA